MGYMNCEICGNPLNGKQTKYCGNPCEKKSYKLRDRKRYLDGKKEYREKNKDKILEYNRKYRSLGLKPLNKKMKEKIKKSFNNMCARCKAKEDLNVHHIRPLIKGGTHKASNLIVLCFHCHMEWEKRMKDYWQGESTQ